MTGDLEACEEVDVGVWGYVFWRFGQGQLDMCVLVVDVDVIEVAVC
jgi:hypothetical protein